MDREEILAKSKQENRGQDIVNLEVSKAGIQFGWVMIICLLCAVSVVDAIVFGRTNYGIFFSVLAALSATFFYKYRKLGRRHELIIAIADAVGAIGFLIGWILQLAGK